LLETAWRWLNSDALLTLAADPSVRLIVFAFVVYGTLLVIGRVYDYQNNTFQVGLKANPNPRHNTQVLQIPREATSGAMDLNGVQARVTISYCYEDMYGRRRRKELVRNVRMVVMMTIRASPRREGIIFGHEIPDVATEDVILPPASLTSEHIAATPERARDFAEQTGVLQSWEEDDYANIVTAPASLVDRVNVEREAFIVHHAEKLRASRGSSFLRRLSLGKLARERPNVMGTYELKLDFPKDPIFLLTRHPDRDLRMTAWLTILTSFFTMLIELWPKAPPP